MTEAARRRLAGLALEACDEPLVLDDASVEALVRSTPADGVVALLGAAIAAGVVSCSDDATRSVAETHAERLVAVVRLDTLLADCLDVLDAAGIECRVLKGAAVAHLDEFDPAWRTYGDVDLLVPPEELVRAADRLVDLGLRPLHEPVRRWWADRYAKSITLALPDGRQVDLHRRLASAPLGDRIDASALFDRPDVFPLGGRTATAMPRAWRLAHACLHAALSPRRSLRQRRDVALLCALTTPRVAEEAVAAGWDGSVLADSVAWAADGAPIPDTWLDWASVHALDEMTRRRVDAARGTFREQVRSAVGELPPVDRLLFVSGLVWPSRAHLQSRGASRPAHLRAWLGRDR